MSRSSLALNNLRACAILSLLAFHSFLAYLSYLPKTAFAFDSAPYRWVAFPIVDTQRWFAFDLFCALQDVYLMSLMFFLSGVFVWPSLLRKGEGLFVQSRFLRLCVPGTLVVLVLMPIAHYPTYSVTAIEPGFAAFWEHWRALPFWPSGPPWFLWQLFVLNVAAAALFRFAPQWGKLLAWASSSAHADPTRYFFGLVIASALAYVPLALLFGPWSWFEYSIFAYQLSRPLHYAVYFFAGVGVGIYGLERGLLAADGTLARRWATWLAAAFVAFVLWMGATALSLHEHASTMAGAWIVAHLAFVVACASGCLCALAIFLRFAARPSPRFGKFADNAYGIFLVHYVFVVWLQYALLDAPFSAVVKGVLVFGGVVVLSYAAASAMQRAPIAERLIGADRRVFAKAQ
jgi:glucans biosynthesis protein C